MAMTAASARLSPIPEPRPSSRRRLAVFLVLILAALATAGTSASPQPPPAVRASAGGSIEVTRNLPFATVDVAVVANAALRSADTDRTQVLVRAFANGVAGAVPAAVVTVEELDGERRADTDASASLTSQFDEDCGAGECRRAYRISVALLDPVADDAKFTWAIEAGSRFGPGDASGSPPPDAKLAIEAGATVRRGPGDIRIVSVEAKLVTLDAAHPRTVLTWDLTRPPVGATRGQSPQLVLRVDGPDEVPTDRPDGTLIIELDGVRVGLAGLGTTRRTTVLGLPRTCHEPAGCRAQLSATFDWAGGDPDEPLSQAWGLTGISFAGPAGDTVPFVFGGPTRASFGPDSAQLVATTTGSFDIAKGRFATRDVTVVLDATALPQGGKGLRGVIVGTLTGIATADGATARTRINLSVGERGFSAVPGPASSVASGPIEIECRNGRSRCTAQVHLAAGVGPDDPVDAHVEWTFTATFLSADPGRLPPAVRLMVLADPVSS